MGNICGKGALKRTEALDSNGMQETFSAPPIHQKAMMTKKPSKDNILGTELRSLEKEYQLGRELGRGQFGVTRVAVHTKTGLEFACKTLPKRYMTRPVDVDNANREVEILKHLTGHPNIVEYVEAFEDTENVHMVMEFLRGGMLFDRITARGYYSEFEAAGIMRTIVEVIKYMHDNGVVHRDLKPENFMLSNNSEQAELKMIDFGLSAFFKPGQVFTELVGSAYYVAPEVLKRRYGPEVDIWSAGVILYILLCGVPPFWHFSEKGIMEAVLKGVVDLSSDPWPTISEQAKDLVRKMLTYDPKKRITPEEILEHEWIRIDGTAPRVPVCSSIHQRVRQYIQMTRFKRAAFHFIAKDLPEDQNNSMREHFQKLDQSSKGFLTFETMKQGLHNLRASKNLPDLPDDEVRAMVNASDIDGNGLVDYIEFFAATMSKNDKVEKDAALKSVFDRFDKNRDGLITVDELKETLAEELTGSTGSSSMSVDEMLQQAERNKDGGIDFSEFAYMMRHGNGPDELQTSDPSCEVVEATNKLGIKPSMLPAPSRISLQLSPKPSKISLGILVGAVPAGNGAIAVGA